MCERPSALIHKSTRQIVAANLDSHSGTREAFKIGDKNTSWLEIEWPKGAPQIQVRADDPKEYVDWITQKWPMRDEFYAYVRKLAEGAGWFYIVETGDYERLPADWSGHVCIDGAALTKLEAPKATTVYASGCAALTKLEAPKATTVYANGCAALTKLEAPEARYVYASGCAALTKLEAPEARYVDASGCAALTKS